MTKQQFTEICQKAASGGLLNSDLNKRYDSGLIKGLATLAYSQIIANIYKTATKTTDYSGFNNLIKTYTVPVKFDSNTEEYYCTLPVKIIYLEGDGGIRSIVPNKDRNYELVYRDNISGIVYSSQEIDKLLTRPRFYVEGNNVRFEKGKFNKHFKELLFKLLPSLEAFDDDEEIGIIADGSFDIFMNIQKVLQTMPPSKPQIDGAEKQV